MLQLKQEEAFLLVELLLSTKLKAPKNVKLMQELKKERLHTMTALT